MKTKNKLLIGTIVIFLCFVSIFVFISNSFTLDCFAYSTSAKGCVVLETSTKRKLYSFNENKKMPMASTTKIMTAITAIENCKDLDEKFEVSPKSIGIPGTSLYLREGDCYSTRELLFALMLISGNDCSVAIAEHVAGSTSEFLTMMNDLARKIGAHNSHFANTHGLDADGHYTTAYDLALISSYALENETFKEIVSTKNVKISNANGGNKFLRNKNKLLFTLDGCIGVKTGYTDDAGRCLVSAIERNGVRFVCVVLNCRPMFEESAFLLQDCADNFKLYDLSKFYNFDRKVKVLNGKEDFSTVGTMQKFLYPLSENEIKNLRFEYNIPDFLNAPISKNTEIGNVKIFLGNDLLFSEKIFTIYDIKPKSLLQRFSEFVENW